MKQTIQVNRKELMAAINGVPVLKESRTNLPILCTWKIAINSKYLTFTMTDMEYVVKRTVPITVMEDGNTDASFLISATTFTNFIKKVKSDKIGISYNSDDIGFKLDGLGTVTLTSDKLKLDLALEHKVKDFPFFKFDTDAGKKWSIYPSKGELMDALDCVSGSISTEETRYYLNGVSLKVYDTSPYLQTATLAASDGHRLSVTSLECEYQYRDDVANSDEDNPDVIIPREAIMLIQKLFKHVGADEVVNIAYHDKAFFIGAEGTTLMTKLIDATFPDYSRVIPKDENIVTESPVNKNELISAIERVTLVSGEFGVIILVDDAGNIAVTGKDVRGNEASETLDAPTKPVPFTQNFNAKYLTQILKQVSSDIVFLCYVGEGEAMQIKSSYEDIHIIMPMRR